jgi:hypothetical protein
MLMPLDTGDIAIEVKGLVPGDELAHMRPTRVRLDETGPLGAALRAARRSLGLEVEDIALATRMRPGYVRAIEGFDFAALPSRPFVIGFVRAYARALGLDAEAVVARFRAEAPPVDDDLKAPVTIDRRTDWGARIVVAAASLVVLAVVGWNVWRHAEIRAATRPAVIIAAAPPSPAVQIRQVSVGAPLPMPPEADAPPSYQTPGLPPTAAAPADGPAQDLASARPVVDGAPFHTDGPVFGAPAPSASVVLQARVSTALVVRGPDGAIIFARQLAAGEAWRAPRMAGLTVEADVPAAVEVFVDGAAHGVLADARVSLASLAG